MTGLVGHGSLILALFLAAWGMVGPMLWARTGRDRFFTATLGAIVAQFVLVTVAGLRHKEDRMTDAQHTVHDRASHKERRRLEAQQKEAEQRRRARIKRLRKGLRWGFLGLIAATGLGWLGYSVATAKRLPPTSMTDHVEVSPAAHILTEPMPLAIQKHMLEHADGGGPPGVIINYNCTKFRCPDGTVDRLAAIARAYPTFVYLAPFPEMDVRIAVTRLGKILVADDVDEARIRRFIED